MEINRVKTCPTLVRCFWKLHRNNGINSYRMSGQGQFPNQEVQIYTWPDATLRELCELLQDVIPGASKANASLIFCLVFVDRQGNLGIKQIGQVSLAEQKESDAKTLSECSYVSGDYLDIAVKFASKTTD